MLDELSALLERAKSGQPKKIAVAAAADRPVLEAIRNAMKEGIVEPILVGNKGEIETILGSLGVSAGSIEIIDVPDPVEASVKAVSLIKKGNADILMKGLVSTGPLLKAVLDKEGGLRAGGLISHVGVFKSPYYHKLIAVTDAAMNVAPSFEEKVCILTNAVDMFHRLGISEPRVAVLAAVETVNPKMEATIHAAMLTQMNRRNQIKGCLVDGPLALDNAVSKEAAEHKGIVSAVAGDADLLLVPNIDSGNLVY